MPMKSQAQARAMQSAARGESTRGISKAVGKEYVKATQTMKTMKQLPKRTMVATRSK